jgi:hypothetical protein
MKGGFTQLYSLFPGPEYRAIFFTECFELVYFGNGGFSWSDVWEMPIIHRRFNHKKIQEHLKRIEEMKNQNNQVITDTTNMSKFKISQTAMEQMAEMASYSTKASPKTQK